MSANETQVGGDHYRSAIQHWDFVLLCRIGYLRARASAYVLRWKKKNGVQDLRKGLHFFDKLLENIGTPMEEPLALPLRCEEAGISLTDFFKANDVGNPETYIISCMLNTDLTMLRAGRDKLAQLIEDETGGQYDIEQDDLAGQLKEERRKLAELQSQFTDQQAALDEAVSAASKAAQTIREQGESITKLTEDVRRAAEELTTLREDLSKARAAAQATQAKRR